jgi:CRP/FNR family transcriptional regulator, cyclic AMP receptor protein
MALSHLVVGGQGGLMDTPALTALLSQTSFGTGLAPETRARLAALGRIVHLPKGHVVVHQGNPSQDLGLLVNGRIALRLGLPGEHDRTIQTLEAGDVFGWSTLLPSAIATSTGITLTPSRAILFEGSGLRTAIAIDSELATAIYHRLFACVARRLEPNSTV